MWFDNHLSEAMDLIRKQISVVGEILEYSASERTVRTLDKLRMKLSNVMQDLGYCDSTFKKLRVGGAKMNSNKVAQELVKIAKELTAADSPVEKEYTKTVQALNKNIDNLELLNDQFEELLLALDEDEETTNEIKKRVKDRIKEVQASSNGFFKAVNKLLTTGIG